MDLAKCCCCLVDSLSCLSKAYVAPVMSGVDSLATEILICCIASDSDLFSFGNEWVRLVVLVFVMCGSRLLAFVLLCLELVDLDCTVV